MQSTLKDPEFKSEHQLKTYYFCSEHCKTKFDTSPDVYLQTKNKVLTESCPDGNCDTKPDFLYYKSPPVPKFTIVSKNIYTFYLSISISY